MVKICQMQREELTNMTIFDQPQAVQLVLGPLFDLFDERKLRIGGSVEKVILIRDQKSGWRPNESGGC